MKKIVLTLIYGLTLNADIVYLECFTRSNQPKYTLSINASQNKITFKDSKTMQTVDGVFSPDTIMFNTFEDERRYGGLLTATTYEINRETLVLRSGFTILDGKQSLNNVQLKSYGEYCQINTKINKNQI